MLYRLITNWKSRCLDYKEWKVNYNFIQRVIFFIHVYNNYLPLGCGAAVDPDWVVVFTVVEGVVDKDGSASPFRN